MKHKICRPPNTFLHNSAAPAPGATGRTAANGCVHSSAVNAVNLDNTTVTSGGQALA
jgi:hypothetical protein